MRNPFNTIFRRRSMTAHDNDTPFPDHQMDEPADGSADAPSDLSEVEQLHTNLAAAQDRYLRLLADYENTKRHHERIVRELREYASEHMITKMLPVLDDLHNAVEHAQTGTDIEAIRTGIAMIYAKAVKIFEDAGLRPVDASPGSPFNVDVHEALMHTPSDVPEGHIVQVVQRGYQLHDKVLRHSKVITSAGLLADPS